MKEEIKDILTGLMIICGTIAVADEILFAHCVLFTIGITSILLGLGSAYYKLGAKND